MTHLFFHPGDTTFFLLICNIELIIEDFTNKAFKDLINLFQIINFLKVDFI